MRSPNDVTPPWDEWIGGLVALTQRTGLVASEAQQSALRKLREAARVVQHADRGPDQMPGCVCFDEDAVARRADRGTTPARDTDPEARQGDKGPYHWAQGPLDVTPVASPAPTEPAPEPTKPNEVPRKGRAVATSNLRVRAGAGTEHPAFGVLPVGSSVELTGARRRHDDGSLWVRVKAANADMRRREGVLRRPDKWLDRDTVGWVNAAFLAVPAGEWSAADFPPVTHEFRWFLDDTMDVPREDAAAALQAIFDDPRGPLRCGLRVTRVNDPTAAHVVVRFVQNPCSGAAGCYYKRSGEIARVDIGRQYWGTVWLSRVALHEVVGHAATRAYDHYDNAPDYPRPDYSGIMGNWTDRVGDHQWPDADDTDNFREWLAGRSPVVFP